MVWTLVEPGVAIIAASLVTIRPLLRQLRFKGFESNENSGSRGFWGRYGRVAKGASKLEDNKANSKRSRATSGMDAFERSVIGLSDLEGGRSVSDARMAYQEGRALPNRDATLTSQDSIGDEDVRRHTGVRNFSTPLGVIHTREEAKEVVYDDEDDDIYDNSLVSPGSAVGARAETHGGLFGDQGREQAGTTLHGHVQNGKTIWRSETLNSPE